MNLDRVGSVSWMHQAAAAVMLIVCADIRAQVPPARADGVLTVSSVGRFEPGHWTLSLQAPANEAVTVTERPGLRIQVQRGQEWLDWGSLDRAEGRLFKPASHMPEYPRYRVSIPPSETLTWRGDLDLWQVLGWPGCYRAEAFWLESDPESRAIGPNGGFRSGRTSGWVEFTVSEGDTAARALQASQAEDGQLWKDYKEAMEAPLALGSLGRPWPGGASPQAGVLIRMASGSPTFLAAERLSREPVLPRGVRHRVGLLQAIHYAAAARAVGRGVERDRLLPLSRAALQGCDEPGAATREVALMLRVDLAIGAGDVALRDQFRGILRGKASAQEQARFHVGLWSRVMGE